MIRTTSSIPITRPTASMTSQARLKTYITNVMNTVRRLTILPAILARTKTRCLVKSAVASQRGQAMRPATSTRPPTLLLLALVSKAHHPGAERTLIVSLPPTGIARPPTASEASIAIAVTAKKATRCSLNNNWLQAEMAKHQILATTVPVLLATANTNRSTEQ